MSVTRIMAWRPDSSSPADPMPVDRPVSRSRVGTVLAIVGSGLLLQGVGDALARSGPQGPAVPLFLIGLVIIFAPCAWRLASANATRSERIVISVVLGLGLLASYIIRSPLILDGFDELAHGATLIRMLDGRSLLPTNTVLPVSPYYPGLELLTIATKWITGLPLLLAQFVVLTAARVVLVLCVFLIVERACGSSRAGGIGVLAYAASPEFYGFDAQYAYETVALAFAVAIVYFLFVLRIPGAAPRRTKEGLTILVILSIGAMIVTHHVTAWLTIAFLMVWATGLYVSNRGTPRSSPNRERSLVHHLTPAGHRGAKGQHREPTARQGYVRTVGLAAIVALVVGAGWTAFVGRRLTGYVDPVFSSAAADIRAALGSLHGNRQLFQNAAGGGSPRWEIALILAAAVCWCLILLASLYSVIWKKSIRGGRLRYIPAAIAAIYPLALLASISSTSKEIAGRATTFIFFGVAIVVGGWMARRLLTHRRGVEQLAAIVVAIVCFLGSMLYGGGPLLSYVPGSYLVGADERSVSSPSLAAANWVAKNLPVGSHIAVDRDNGALLNDIGHVDPVTASSGSVNPSSLFFDRQITSSDVSLIRQANIRYILIDTRLSRSLPLYGTYIAAGETSVPTRLTLAELDKFSSNPLIRRIYDNGPIQIYDLAVALGKSPSAAPPGTVYPTGIAGMDVGIFLLASLVALAWLIRLRRRVERGGVSEHRVVCGLVGAMVIGLFGAYAILLFHLPPALMVPVILALLFGLALMPRGWHPHDLRAFRRKERLRLGSTTETGASASSDPVPATEATNGAMTRGRPAEPTEAPHRIRKFRTQIMLGCAGLALFALGASLSTAAARREWVPPTELSVVFGPTGQPVAGVALGSAGPISAQLDVVRGTTTLWSAPLAGITSTQNVALPANLVTPGSAVRLVSGGHTLREVDG